MKYHGARACAAALLLALSLAVPAVPTATAAPKDLARTPAAIHIHNFGTINDNYYRGAQPKGRDYADLAALGVRTVIDLTRDGESREQRLVEDAGMKFYRIPLTTAAAPSPAAVSQFLRLVTDPANLPVYVHCQGGRHRTGIMTAVYRITQDGWTAERAYDEMRRFDFEGGWVAHTALKDFVFDYSQRHAQARPAEREAVAGAAK